MIQKEDGPSAEKSIALPNTRWTGCDIASAIGMSLTTTSALATGIAAVEAIANSDPSSEILAYAATTALLSVITFAIGLVSGIKLPVLANITGTAMALALAIEVASEASGSDGKFIGAPAAVFQAAIISSMFFAVAWLYSSSKYNTSLAALGFVKAQGRLPYLQAAGAWLLALAGLVTWGALTQNIEWLQPPDNTSQALDLAGGSIVLALPLVGILAPFAEEVFFRGFVLRGLLKIKRIGPVGALTISSAIFTVFHGFDPGLYAPIFLLGLAMGWVYLRTGSIWPSVLVHVMQNSFALISTWQDFGS